MLTVCQGLITERNNFKQTTTKQTRRRRRRRRKRINYLWVCLADVDQKLVHQSTHQTARGVNAGNELRDHLHTHAINITVSAANNLIYFIPAPSTALCSTISGAQSWYEMS
jgi:hypothetical protein